MLLIFFLVASSVKWEEQNLLSRAIGKIKWDKINTTFSKELRSNDNTKAVHYPAYEQQIISHNTLLLRVSSNIQLCLGPSADIFYSNLLFIEGVNNPNKEHSSMQCWWLHDKAEPSTNTRTIY